MLLSAICKMSANSRNRKRTSQDVMFIVFSFLSIRNKINIYSQLVLFPLYFTKFSLNNPLFASNLVRVKKK